MKKLSIFVILIFFLVNSVLAASPYTIDGDLSDWGISSSDLSNGFGGPGNENYWLPSSSTCDYVVEDDVDPAHQSYCTANPTKCNPYDYGVHITGEGSSYGTYNEPLLALGYVPPWYYEVYDIEAMYFDDWFDNGIGKGYAYFAIITSAAEDTPLANAPGDLALDIDDDGDYEYGIKLTGSDKGQVCSNPVWEISGMGGGEWRFTCAPGDVVGTADVAWGNPGVSDHSYNNHVIEVEVWKYLIGLPEQYDTSSLHATMLCGNDVVDLEIDWDFEAPEFIMSGVAFAILLITPAFAFLVIRRRQ